MVSANACWYFKQLAKEAEQASLDVLAKRTVADALHDILQRSEVSEPEPQRCAS